MTVINAVTTSFAHIFALRIGTLGLEKTFFFPWVENIYMASALFVSHFIICILCGTKYDETHDGKLI